MADHTVTDRCRLVLILPEGFVGADADKRLADALAAGDVASVIVPCHDLTEAAYQAHLEAVCSLTAGLDVAVLGVDDTRAVGRARADGVMMIGGQAALGDTLAKHRGAMIVGCGHVNSRDEALKRAELEPDFIFFGRIGKDILPAAHPRNLEIATWWSQMVETPCIVLGGTDVETIHETASTGADFVALSQAVFGPDVDCATAVMRANAILADHVFADG